MNVLYVDQFGKTTGRDTLALADLIQSDDIHMTVYLSDATEIPTNKLFGVKIVKGFHGAYEGNMLNKIIKYLKSLCELKLYIKTNHFDIVHLQWFSLPWIEWVYIKLLRKYSKIIITVHDIVPFDKRPFEMMFLDSIYGKADRLLLHTDRVKNEFSIYYKAKTPISVITQGFCNKSDYKKIDKAEARTKLDIPSEAIVFLFYGTIRSSKGLDTLMKAIVEAQKHNPNIYLLAAGAFHKVDETVYKKLADSLIENGSKITFGFLPYEMEKYYFSAADVLVLPYTEGTQSGVAQLGLMYELPLIASDIACMDDVAKRNINSLRFSASNVSELVDCICLIAEDESMRINFSLSSKLIGETDYSLNNKAQKVIDAYKEVTYKLNN